MKLLDVAGTGVKVAAAAAKALAAPVVKAFAARPPQSPEAAAELRYRAEVNARAERMRDERERALFGAGRWMPRRRGWLERGR